MMINLQSLILPFIRSFYGEVICSPKRLAGLYCEGSVYYAAGNALKGTPEIVQGLEWRSQMTHQIHSSNILPYGDAILVVVIGELIGADTGARQCFYETFVIVQQGEGRVNVSCQSFLVGGDKLL